MCLTAITIPNPLPAQARSRSDTARATPDTTSPQSLRPVTIVTTPARRDQPLSATTVNAVAIRTTPATSTYDLLRQTAGLEVHDQGQGPGFASNAALRGFSSDHSTDVALWIDGVPVNEPVNGHAEGYNDFSVLFPGGVQDIDVIRGPSSALFGNFALAGVVNVRTLSRMRGTELTTTGGSYGDGEAVLLTGVDNGPNGGGVLGLRYRHDDGFRPRASNDLAQLHARGVRDLSPGVTLDAGLELYGARWRSPGYLSEDEFAARQYDIASNPTDRGYKRRAQERVSLRVLRGDLLWRTTAYATQGRWQLFLTIPPAGGRFEGTGSQTEEEDRRYGLGLTSAATWVLGRGDLTLGLESRLDHARYENYFTTDRSRDSVAADNAARQLAGAVFLQWQWDVTPRLRIDLGGRYDGMDTRATPTGAEVDASTSAGHGVLSPKGGALVRLTRELRLYGSIARGFRSTDGVLEDPHLTPIVAWSYEGGAKWDRGGARASAAVFQMDVSNEQTFDPFTGEANNGGRSRRRGVELDWRVPLAPLVIATGDWTFNDAKYRRLIAIPEDGGEPETLSGLRVFNTARYVGNSALEIIPASLPLRFRVAGSWVGPYSPFDQPGEEIGGYGLAHVGASVHWGRYEGDLGIRNVLDRAYPEIVAGHLVAPGQPRSLFVTLRTHW